MRKRWFSLPAGAAVILFLLPLPSLAVNPNFYQYSVRHEKGAPPWFPILKVENETVNSANGNLFFTVPLVSRPGRAGLGVNLALAYNSKFWEHSGGYATLAERDSWVGLGWTLLVGRVIDDSPNGHYYVTLSDGSNHDLTYYGGAWRSRDSSFMFYDPASFKLTLKGGLNLRFNYVDPSDPSIRYATRVQDTNGNYIEVNYTGSGGRISNIQDTLGNTYTFVLGTSGAALNRLQQIQYLNTNGTTSTVTLSYQAQTISFGAQEPTDPAIANQHVLTQVIYPNSMRFVFTYTTSGEVAEITYPTCGKSRYFYSTYQVFDRLLNQNVYEHFVTSHDTGPGSSSWTWTIYLYSGQTAPNSVTINLPGGTIIGHYMQAGGAGWADGFVTKIQDGIHTETRKGWTQDNTNLTTILNPRTTYNEKVLKSQVYGQSDKVARTDFTYAPQTDYSGNVKEIWEYDFNSALRRKTLFSYLHETNSAYVSLNIIDRVTWKSVYNGSGVKLEQTGFGYDIYALYTAIGAIRHDPAFGPGYTTRGLQSYVARYHNLPNDVWLFSYTQYDECGNPRVLYDPKNYATVIEYWLSSADNAFAFPLRVTNPKGHVTLATYSYRSGAVLTQTDANNKTTSMTYDSYDRPTQITKPDGGRRQFIYTGTCQEFVDIKDEITLNVFVTRRGQLDLLGRLTEELLSDPIGGNIEQEKKYNPLSQLEMDYVPHRAGQPESYNSYSYQGNYLSSLTFAEGGNVGYAYDRNFTTVTNTDSKKRRYTYQEDGKVSQVLEEDSSGQLTVATNYAYDAMARLITITQGVQTRSFTYDSLRRLKTETHPESGTTTFTYDANSNLLTRTDARGIVTTYTYDELNRVTQKTYSDATPSVTYTYDVQPAGSPISIQNPVGRLTKVTTTTSGVTASSYYSYCTCSAVSQESTVITDGTTKTYTTSYSYNLASMITSITYPNGKVVSYTRDSLGRETKVSTSVSGQSIDLIQSASYLGPHGGLTEILYGIYTPQMYFIRTLIGYSATTLRMTSYQTHGLSLTYNYIVNEAPTGAQTGHIYGIRDVYNASNSQHFEYDRWYRLTGWWVSNGRTDPYTKKLTWAYDQYGNITSTFRDVDPNNCPGGCTTNFGINSSNNRLTSKTYDAAGNTTTEGTFDAENRLTSGGGVSSLYDGNSRRLRRLKGGIKIYYVYSATGRLMVEDNWTESKTKNQIYFNGQLIATHDQADYVRIIFKDHLGSTRSVVKVDPVFPWGSSWFTTEVYDYYPYGEIFASTTYDPDTTSQKFTGKERDSRYYPQVPLDYFGARYYDSGSSWTPFTAGNPRWSSADSGPLVVYVPETLNRYAYALGDPINYIDLEGLTAVCFFRISNADSVLTWFGVTQQREVFPITLCFLIPPPVRPWHSEFPYCGGGEQGFSTYRREIIQISAAVRIARERASTPQCNKFLSYIIEGLRKNGLLENENLTPEGLLRDLRTLDPLYPCADEDGPQFSGKAKTIVSGGKYYIWLKHAAFGASLYATIIHEAFHVATGNDGKTHQVIKQLLLDAPRWVRRTSRSAITLGGSEDITHFIEANCGPS